MAVQRLRGPGLGASHCTCLHIIPFGKSPKITLCLWGRI